MRRFEAMFQEALGQIEWPEELSQADREDALVALLPGLRAEMAAVFHDALLKDAPGLLAMCWK